MITTRQSLLSPLAPAVVALDLLRLEFPVQQLPPVIAQTWALAQREYQRFLSLKLWYPDQLLVPERLALQVWHAHILDTRAYRTDCDAVFGRMLDYFPYLAYGGPSDVRELHCAQHRYQQLYGQYFD